MIVPERSYLVCATQRSGSTLLCGLLEDTGVAGRPLEFFEACAATGRPPHPGDYLGGLARTGVGIRDDLTPPDAPPYSSLEGLADYRAHLERTLSWGTTPNGVFAAKLMFNQLPELRTLAGTLPEYAGLDFPELLGALFGAPAFVWICREDKVRQAVSLWKALQTRAWRGSTPDPRAPKGEIRYSFEGIDHLVARFEADEDGWRRFFAEHEITPLRISYEHDLEHDRERSVRMVLTHIGVTAPPGWALVEPIARQADALSEEWVATYHRDRARLGSLATS